LNGRQLGLKRKKAELSPKRLLIREFPF